jgi:hypothetical protein
VVAVEAARDSNCDRPGATRLLALAMVAFVPYPDLGPPTGTLGRSLITQPPLLAGFALGPGWSAWLGPADVLDLRLPLVGSAGQVPGARAAMSLRRALYAAHHSAS